MSIELLSDIDFLVEHRDSLVEMFPDVWTNLQNLSIDDIVLKLRGIGVILDVDDIYQFPAMMIYFDGIGLISHNDANRWLVRVNREFLLD